MSGKRKWFYDSIEDGNRRLRGSIVIGKGVPVMIENIVGLNTDQVAQFYPLPIKAPDRTHQRGTGFQSTRTYPYW